MPTPNATWNLGTRPYKSACGLPSRARPSALPQAGRASSGKPAPSGVTAFPGDNLGMAQCPGARQNSLPLSKLLIRKSLFRTKESRDFRAAEPLVAVSCSPHPNPCSEEVSTPENETDNKYYPAGS